MFRECYALEKLHGTSANVSWRDNTVNFSSGGEKASNFIALFDAEALKKAFEELGYEKVTVYGEAYGGKQQKQSWRYGKDLRFTAFDIRLDGVWLSVPEAEALANKLGFEFVHYTKISTDVEAINAECDAPSEQAKRNGIEEDQPREGVVLRPLLESYVAGERVITKHKRDEERETTAPRKVGVDPEVLKNARAIADEWVTPTRLEHVLDKLPQDIGMEKTRDVIVAMLEDVLREGKDEFVDSKEARAAISKKTVSLFKANLQSKLEGK